MEGLTDLAKGPASTRVMSSTRSPSSGGGGRGDGGDGDAPALAVAESLESVDRGLVTSHAKTSHTTSRLRRLRTTHRKKKIDEDAAAGAAAGSPRGSWCCHRHVVLLLRLLPTWRLRVCLCAGCGSGGGETRQRQQNTHTHTTIIADSELASRPPATDFDLRGIGSSCTYAPWTHKPHTITHTGGGTTTRPMAKEEEGPPASLRAARADGLERFYDVVIVGTGLVEAMLSAYVRARVCVGWWGFKLFTLRIFINSNSTMLHAGPLPRSARACCTSKR